MIAMQHRAFPTPLVVSFLVYQLIPILEHLFEG